MYKDIICGIYEIKNVLNDHRYIGSSVHIYRRWGLHKWTLQHNKHRNVYLQRAWNKYGEKCFEFNMLETCEPVKDIILFIEQKYLDLNPAYNLCKVAGNTMGRKHSKEAKRKLSVFRSSQVGKYHHSEESKRLMSVAHIGKVVSEETRSKWRKPMLMIDITSGEIIREFKSIGDAGIFVGHYNRRVEIKKAAQGKRKSAYGYKWEYKNKQNDL